MPVPEDVRRWLQSGFLHIPSAALFQEPPQSAYLLAAVDSIRELLPMGLLPEPRSQTLYTAVNDFIEPKLKQVGGDVGAFETRALARARRRKAVRGAANLRAGAHRVECDIPCSNSRQRINPTHDDGVQITAAPLWSLFRHKPWQKVLKDTWAKLEKGDYDWAHLAMNYWPERVREKCKTDKSLAIAHGLDQLFIEPVAKPKKARGRNNTGAADEHHAAVKQAQDRTLGVWFQNIQQGMLKLPRFQRFEAWDRNRITSFLNTIINNLPVGVALALEVAGREKFESRYVATAEPTRRALSPSICLMVSSGSPRFGDRCTITTSTKLSLSTLPQFDQEGVKRKRTRGPLCASLAKQARFANAALG